MQLQPLTLGRKSIDNQYLDDDNKTTGKRCYWLAVRHASTNASANWSLQSV